MEPAHRTAFLSSKPWASLNRVMEWTALVLLLPLLPAVTACHSRQTQASGQHLDFNEDVQPILASNCFSCHGPDPEMRKAGLRLDVGEDAMARRPGHPDAIVPFHPERSELIKRIESKDPHYLMPQNPQGEAKPMKPAEIAILKEWIREGAVYRPHWAFEKPVRPLLPSSTAHDPWVKTPIFMALCRDHNRRLGFAEENFPRPGAKP